MPNEITDAKKHDVKISEDSDNFTFLKALCEQGMKDNKLKGKVYKERLNYELETLNDLGFIDYILLVGMLLIFAKAKKLPLVRQRKCGWLPVLYLIGSTGIDPIKYELFFERFIKNEAKKKVVDGVTYLDGSLMVDVDIDVCYHGRQEVLSI